MHLDNESINFVEGDTMIILSNVNHVFDVRLSIDRCTATYV